MRRPLNTLVLLGLAGLLGLVAAQPAAGFGDTCVADDSEAGWTTLVTSNGSGYSPLGPPEGPWVITAWTVEATASVTPIQQQLVTSKPLAPHEDVLVGASAVETVVAGRNEFKTRIPIPEYAHIGLRGPVETLYCDAEGHGAAVLEGPWAVGEPRTFETVSGVGAGVVALAEPDADADGYGDHSQDRCPQSAATQAACPTPAPAPVVPEASLRVKRKVYRRAVAVRVRASGAASVQVFGQVGWKVRPKGRTRDGKRKPNRRVSQGLSAGSARSLAADTEATFRVRLPKTVKRRLSRLTRKQALRPVITVRATDSLGRVTTERIKPKLRGWRKR